MRFQMVRHCAACVIPALLKVSTAAVVLVLGYVAHQCLSTEWLPMFGAVQRAICLCFRTPFFAHFILYIVYCWRWHTKCRFCAAGGGSSNALRDWLTLPLRAVGPRRFFRRLKVYLCIRWLRVFCPYFACYVARTWNSNLEFFDWDYRRTVSWSGHGNDPSHSYICRYCVHLFFVC